MTSVNKVAQKDVGRVWWPSSCLEQIEKIKELTMKVTHNCHRRYDWLYVGLLHQQVRNLGTQPLEVLFAYAFACFQPLNTPIHIQTIAVIEIHCCLTRKTTTIEIQPNENNQEKFAGGRR